MTTPPPSARTRVRREPARAAYDRATVDAVLDATPLCHLAFVHDGQPYAVPTLHARVGDTVYVHGSAASRALRTVGGALPACITVSLLDGLVVARSVFEHSVNYRSVMLLGTLSVVADEEKLVALEAFTEAVLPGRWAEARTPAPKELAATDVLAMTITEASAKIRTGGPDDGDGPDADLEVWAGTVPLERRWGAPVPDPAARRPLPVPASVLRLLDGSPA